MGCVVIGYVYALRVHTRPPCYVVGSTAVAVSERVAAYFDPARSHGHLANLVRRAGRRLCARGRRGAGAARARHGAALAQPWPSGLLRSAAPLAL